MTGSLATLALAGLLVLGQYDIGIRMDSDAPLDIEAQELEASRAEDGRQRVIFKREVRVSQEELRIGCDWLEALYPSGGGGKPERITCRGSVRIRQGEVEARCDEAVFVRAANQALCRGQPAALQRGENRVEGPQIEFDTLHETITVKGGARIRVQPEPREAAP